MILEEKNISDVRALKMVARLLKRQPPGKGFRIDTENGAKRITCEELVEFIYELAKRLEEGRYQEVKTCDTCGNYSRSGKYANRGACFPKEYTSSRKSTDHCSGWVPMDKDQQFIKEKMDEHFGKS
jgi:hypothetical protein